MIIGSILKGKGTEVVSVRPDDTVLTVARTLGERRIGAALVRDAAGAMLGIIWNATSSAAWRRMAPAPPACRPSSS